MPAQIIPVFHFSREPSHPAGTYTGAAATVAVLSGSRFIRRF